MDWNLFDFGDGDEVAARSLRSFDAHLRGEHERGCVHLARVFLADPVPVLEHARDEARPKGHDPIQLVPIGKHDRGEVPHEPNVALGFGDGLPPPSNLRLRADLPVLTPAGEGLVEPRDAESVAVPLLQRGLGEQRSLRDAVVLCAEFLGPAHRPGLALDRELVRRLTERELPFDLPRLVVPPPRVRGAREERQERQSQEGARHHRVIPSSRTADLNLNNFDILATENRLRPPTERTSRCSAPWTVFPASRPSSFTPRP